jgi:hypothetical protein
MQKLKTQLSKLKPRTGWVLFPVVVGAALAMLLSSFAGVALSYTISQRQDRQINELKNISEEVKDVANALKSRHEIDRRVAAFLSVASGHQFTCVVPISHVNKPFPLIALGDHHVLEIFNRTFDPRKMVPELVDRKERKTIKPGHTVFVCSPKANSPLEAEYGYDSVANQKSLTDLPCWFARESEPGSEPELTVIKKYDSPQELIYSAEARAAHQAAFGGTTSTDNSKPMDDYGILARLTGSGHTHIIIAGIHQHGTWLVTEYLDRILHGFELPFGRRCFEDRDFITVIHGYFDMKTFRLLDKPNALIIHNGLFWQKVRGNWQLIREHDPT